MTKVGALQVGGFGRQFQLSLGMFVTVLVFLCLSCFILDAGFYGPITAWVGEKFVEEPVQEAWGFRAEWRSWGTVSKPVELLTVVKVTPGGSFDRSGIRVGYAFAPLECTTGGPLLGGHFHSFGDRHQNARVRMVVGATRWEVKLYEIVRPAA